MNAKHIPILQLTRQSSLIQDYLNKHAEISELVSVFPSVGNFEQIIAAKKYPMENREVLVRVLKEQYKNLNYSQRVSENIELLKEENTYTVTTGHQLCLFTGPLYFIYKIISVIKLAELLREKYPSKNFIPVYWMATEDHDLEEINHSYFFGKKITWETAQTGAVGPMSTEGISSAIEEVAEILGSSAQAAEIINLLKRAYSEKTLADATRYLVNELFGKYGVVSIDANRREFKAMFAQTMKNDLFEHTAYKAVTSANEYLTKQNYKVQINPREVNLFYLTNGIRQRIERSSDDKWIVVDEGKSFNRSELEVLLKNEPELFSPNVILRPLFQESILPNLAYIGGPGETAYWLQLRSAFTAENLAYPMLILRDSALLLNSNMQQRMEKLGLSSEDLFGNPEEMVKQLVHSEDISLEEEKQRVKDIFSAIAAKLKEADSTLEKTALAESQKQQSAIDHLEKKAIRALKQREENKINQFYKLYNECFPDGVPQERHDNYFQHALVFGIGLIDELYEFFNPLDTNFHLVEQEAVLQQ